MLVILNIALRMLQRGNRKVSEATKKKGGNAELNEMLLSQKAHKNLISGLLINCHGPGLKIPINDESKINITGQRWKKEGLGQYIAILQNNRDLALTIYDPNYKGNIVR